MNIRKSIRAVMYKLDINQSELASRAELSISTLSFLMNGKRMPSGDSLERLAGVGGMTVSEFLAAGE
jgi:transcriptional regulator with XRE-family HTH domain|tara:strand:+ start:273 stop:473 length:201 start_codon:yes stop_codon:yes gene_type:complete